MQTHGHYVLNLALLGKTIAPKHNIAITIGAILPDIPLFIFYLIAKYIYHLPEGKIWGEAYYDPDWQNIFAISHSIPLALIGFVIFWCLDWKWGAILCVSMVFHCLLDLPVHNHDAHRHFYPVSDYRFYSPFSYWDINHHAKIVAGIEAALVLIASPLVMDLLKTPYTKGILILINVLYLLTYSRILGLNIVVPQLVRTLILMLVAVATPLLIFVGINKEQSLKKLQYYKITVLDKLKHNRNTD